MKKLTKQQVLIGATGLLIVLAAAGIFINKSRNTDTAESPQTTNDNSGINYGPPTEEEKAQAEKHKEDLARQMAQGSQSSSSQKKQITPVITNASQSGQEITINAYIPGIFENGGTCTVTFTKGSQ